MKITNVCTNCQIVCGAGKADRAYVIFSYGTPVLAVDCSGMKPRLVRLWSGWSATTQRHINKALDMMPGGNRYGKISKAVWERMPVEEVNAWQYIYNADLARLVGTNLGAVRQD